MEVKFEINDDIFEKEQKELLKKTLKIEDSDIQKSCE